MTQVVLDSFELSYIFPTDDMTKESVERILLQSPKVQWATDNGITVKIITTDVDDQLKRDYHIIADLDEYQQTEYFLRF